jgi:hypothetical protein
MSHDEEESRPPELSANPRGSRRLRLLVPRFGPGWLFVGMLFLISAAGWWKFHRDLYVEEVEVIRALRNHADIVTVRRAGDVELRPAQEEDFDGAVPWNAPLLPRVERISVEGELTKELRDGVTALPRVKSIFLRPSRAEEIERAAEPSEPIEFDFEANLNRSLPESPPAALAIDSVSNPLPDGEVVSDAEAARIAAAIYRAWRDEEAVPPSFLVVSRNSSLVDSTEFELETNIVEPDRRYFFCDRDWFQQAAILSDGVSYSFFRNHGDPWRCQSRDAEAEIRRNDEVVRRFPDDSFPYIATDFFGFLTVERALRAMPRFEFARVAKVDDVRYRVDFSPFAAARDERDAQSNLIDPQVTEWSLVLRSDLSWAPEESKMVQRIHQTSWKVPKTYERQISQRFQRHGGYVLLTERAVRGGGGPAGSSIGTPFSSHLYAYDIDPEYDERIFDPTSLDPDAWLARREPPWLRWYRVTFLLGCGLAVVLLARRAS